MGRASRGDLKRSAPQDDAAQVPSKRSRGLIIGRVQRLMPVLLILALGAVALLLPWDAVIAALRATHPGWLVVAVLAHLAILPFWVAQWRQLARPFADVPARVMAGVVAQSIAARVTLSGAVGVAAGFLGLTARAGLTPQAAGAVMAADQALAALMKLAVLALAVALLPLPPVPAGVLLSGAAVLALAVLAVLLGRSRLRLPQALDRGLRDLARIATGGGMAAALALAVVKKGTEVAAAMAVQAACGLHAGWGGALLAVAAVSLSTLLPVMPANLGTHSAAVAGAYVLLGHPAGLAVSAGLVHHATLLVASALVAGAVALAGRGRA